MHPAITIVRRCVGQYEFEPRTRIWQPSQAEQDLHLVCALLGAEEDDGAAAAEGAAAQRQQQRFAAALGSALRKSAKRERLLVHD